jgi:hypothetical protein
LVTLLLNSTESKETLKLITFKNQALNTNITVNPTQIQAQRLQSRKSILSVISEANGLLKSKGFQINAKIKIENSSENLAQSAYKLQINSLVSELEKLNVSKKQITISNYKLQQECQMCFLIKLKSLNFIASADLSIQADNFYAISKLLESKNYLFEIEVFIKFDYESLQKEIKNILKFAVEKGISEALKKLDNTGKEIKSVLSTSISVNSIDTVYNYKNEELKLQYADKFLKHQMVDFILRINFLIGNKINNNEEMQIDLIKSLQEKIVNSIASNALNAYVDSD